MKKSRLAAKKRGEQTKEKGKPFIWSGRKRDGSKPVGPRSFLSGPHIYCLGENTLTKMVGGRSIEVKRLLCPPNFRMIIFFFF